MPVLHPTSLAASPALVPCTPPAWQRLLRLCPAPHQLGSVSCACALHPTSLAASPTLVMGRTHSLHACVVAMQFVMCSAVLGVLFIGMAWRIAARRTSSYESATVEGKEGEERLEALRVKHKLTEQAFGEIREAVLAVDSPRRLLTAPYGEANDELARTESIIPITRTRSLTGEV